MKKKEKKTEYERKKKAEYRMKQKEAMGVAPYKAMTKARRETTKETSESSIINQPP